MLTFTELTGHERIMWCYWVITSTSCGLMTEFTSCGLITATIITRTLTKDITTELLITVMLLQRRKIGTEVENQTMCE